MPIDARHLIEGCNPDCRHTGGPLRGAFALDAQCLLTLDELTEALPTAANAAYYLQAQTDGLIVVDIEPNCPPDVAADLLQLPGIAYREVSMSGRGFHLVTPMPQNFHEFPVAAGKRVLREQHGWYEILFDHWCTFTRTPIPDNIAGAAAASTRPAQFATVEALYADLAVKARQTSNASATAVSTGATMPDIPYAAKIIERTLPGDHQAFHDPARFDHDLSRWEFSVLARLYHRLRAAQRPYESFGIAYSASDTAWLLHRAALDVLPFRPKHAQTRNGRPFLLDRAAALVAEREADDARSCGQSMRR
ncbi:hypothetical protein [Streptomyces sp. NRRL F-5053]|uniref:hypothetical protein n=1 Tax=Streptomyces sp. NRRL F-5053 TaxID=1463854 RepID=UPI000A9229AE|nr:hypothetical protein [Streptomyces sp. NRRL F-5053]